MCQDPSIRAIPLIKFVKNIILRVYNMKIKKICFIVVSYITDVFAITFCQVKKRKKDQSLLSHVSRVIYIYI